MTLKFGNLIVFSANNILPFINDLVVDDPVRLITCEEALWISIPSSSAQGSLDVSNLWRPGKEEKVKDEVLGVLRGARDIARER